MTLTKELTGDGAGQVPAGTVFPFAASWTDLLGNPQEVDVQVKAGESAIIENVPLGTEVRLVEKE